MLLIIAKGDCLWCVAEIGVAVAGCIATGVSGGAAIIACVSGIIGAGFKYKLSFILIELGKKLKVFFWVL